MSAPETVVIENVDELKALVDSIDRINARGEASDAMLELRDACLRVLNKEAAL